MGATSPNGKSVVVTYLLWLVFGIFGGHHLYLERDAQAFLWWSTLGGVFGLGWLRDLFCIPRYVAEANNDPELIQKHIKQLKANNSPPFSVIRFMGMMSVGYFFASLVQFAIPVEPMFEIDWNFLNILVPLPCAIGVWLVGNLGKEQGTFWWPLIGAYATYPLSVYFDDESTWFWVMVLASALAFDTMAKEWRRTPRKKHNVLRRVTILGGCGVLYLCILTSFFYFNAKVMNSEGEEFYIREAIVNFFTSPWWVDLKQSLNDIYIFAQHHGWYQIWLQIIDMSDPQGEINAYKVLGVDSRASQSEITAKWRNLSKEFHPDKVKDPLKKSEAQNKFMEIQQAYEILSKVKSQRKKRNKKFTAT